MVICDTTKSQQQDQLPITHSTNRIVLESTAKEQQIHPHFSASSLSVLGSCNIGNSTPNTIQNNGSDFSNGDCDFDNNNHRLIDGKNLGATTQNQLQQLNTMREALFAQDGWGCQHVNQDTNWEVPSSPEPSNKDSSGTPLWKPSINNGTDLWESNLRNGGQPPSQPIQKTPWSHTPSSNLGGTWGEDDDGTEGNNVWTGTGGNQGNGAVVIASGNSTNVSSVGPNALQPQWNQSNVGVNVNTNNNANIASSTNISGVAATGLNNSTGGSGGTNNGGGTNNNNGNVWGDPRDMRSGQVTGSLDIRNVDVRDSMRAPSAADSREMRMLDPRDPIRGDPRGISGRLNGTSEMWGQHQTMTHSQMPATINKMIGPSVNSGSLNSNSSNITGSNVVSVAGVGSTNTSSNNTTPTSVPPQWGNTQTAIGTKEMTSLQSGNKTMTGWEEPSPPQQRRTIPNYDDGTSLWSQQSRVPVSGSHWKDISDPISRSHMIRSSMCSQNVTNPVSINNTGVQSTGTNVCTQNISSNPNNSIQNRLTSATIPPKSDSSMWSHASSSGRNTTSWTDDGNHNLGTAGPNWVEEKTASSIGQIGANVGNANTWNDSNSVWNKHNQNKITTSTGWGSNEINGDISTDWSSHPPMMNKPPQKLNSGIGVDMVKQSKQYRILIENGFKKEDVERALISSNMNLEEAAEMLRASVFTADNWRRQDETIGSFSDHSGTTVVGGFPGRYPASANQSGIAFPPNNLLNSLGSTTSVGISGNNPNIPTLNSLQTLQVQKYLNQSTHNVTTPGSGSQTMNTFVQQATGNSAVNSGANTNNQPSAQQLRMLVQQIQLAVQSGYLSSQILNQPLAPTTLLLLNQLLTSIKHLQGAQQSLSRGSSATNLQINVAIAKYKQQIQNLQNQINAQQAIYIKQQSVQQSSHNAPTPHSNTEFLRGHDAMIQNNFSDITLNKTGSFQGTSNHQSRLNQWKLPMLEKDVSTDNADFSRAPGTTKTSLNPPNIGSLTLQNDGAWSAGRNIGDGWPEATTEENKDWPVAQPSTASSTYTDLVQEFEPGKPWKGSQIKTIEDDPSITPGSVARSPLSISSTPKDADLFAANNTVTNKSPTDLPSLALTSSTWSFHPNSSNNQNFPSWTENQQCTASELWTTPINKSSRGPPPGLGGNVGKNIVSSNVSNNANPNLGTGVCSNGWLVGNGGPRNNTTNTNIGWTPTSSNNSWNSNWLLLKNLNAQIDGSTLRTLCIQHGPLLNFQLYLNQGIALCKYATREEANKAQMTLNNCVLGSTTICAESPNETEVQNILQHLPQAQQSLQQSTTLASLNPNGNNVPSIGSNAGGSSNGNVGNSNNGSNSNITTGSNTQAHNIAANSNSGSSSSPSSVNAPSASNQTTWRQQPQNPSRPSGRENDFDYISKYVCSIVDD